MFGKNMRSLAMAGLLWGIAAQAGDLGGWIPYWSAAKGLESLQRSQGRLEDIFLFAIHLDATGNPIPVRPREELHTLVRNCQSAGAKVWLTVVNDREETGGRILLKDRTATHDLLRQEASRTRHIQELVRLCQEFQVAGLDLDYESLEATDRSNFSHFVRELGEALHARGLLLSVTVEPKSRESSSRGPGAADWSSLGQIADRLQIMLYNLHYTRTAPGPAATASWMREIMAYAETQCPHIKLRPALKVGGFEWGQRPREITLAEISRIAGTGPARRNPDGQTPSWLYMVGREPRVAFCEDTFSLEDKIRMLHGLGYPQVILWSLGAEDPSFWSRRP